MIKQINDSIYYEVLQKSSLIFKIKNVFRQWVADQLLSNIPKNSLIIMDSSEVGIAGRLYKLHLSLRGIIIRIFFGETFPQKILHIRFAIWRD